MAPKVKEDPSSDSDASSSGRSSSPEDTKPGVKAGTKKESESSDSEESSNSESGKEETKASGESGSDEDSDSSSDEEEAPAQTQQSKNGPSNTASRPAKAFKPPSGFKQVKKQSLPSSEISSLLSNARGKQIFHITAPSYLPLSKVKEVSMGKVMQGEPVLNYEGVNYGIPQDNMGQGDKSEKKVLLYDSKTETYYNAPVRNIQSYHIQEMISLPQEAINDSNAGAASEKAAKPVRKQPANLKMRFRPVGSSYGPPETIGSSSDESEGEKPTKASKDKEERKRKHHHTEGDGKEPGSRKKSKKHSSPDGPAQSSQMEVDEEPKAKKSKKYSKHRDEKKRRKESV